MIMYKLTNKGWEILRVLFIRESDLINELVNVYMGLK